MAKYISMSNEGVAREKKILRQRYDYLKGQNLNLDISRGKPGLSQIKISTRILDIVTSSSECKTETGVDCRNYGLLDGIPRMKRIFSHMLGVDEGNIMVGGNSSLSLMFDVVSHMMTHGVPGCKPWAKCTKIKFLCPVPGYDRHFSILEYFGITPICIPMTDNGPDMNLVEQYVNTDDSVKGIWCVPKYSNPQGITYSDSTVKRFAALRPKAKDFRIFWDNAYAIHKLVEEDDHLMNIMDECKKNNTQDLPILFCSTSKITFPGSGVAALAASEANLELFRKRWFVQTIGFDKINQLRHVLFFTDFAGVLSHMELHRQILRPKFDLVSQKLHDELSGMGIAEWIIPRGGYFVSIDIMPNTAKQVVHLAKEAGVIITPAGSTFPCFNDPLDRNIRLAPTYPPLDELSMAMDVFCTAVKITALEQMYPDV